MHFLWISLSIGLAGSLHCIGMCGPLVSAMHIGGSVRPMRALWYHIGRASGYAVLGLVMGLVGFTMQLVVTQQWMAIFAGVVMFVPLIWPTKLQFLPKAWTQKLHHLRQSWMQHGHAGRPRVLVGMGVLNAWLPCGLVYSALAASVLTASPLYGALFMFVFGIANTPALLFSTRIILFVHQYFGVHNKKNIQIFLMAFALLVVLRGAGLGIPYLSPQLSSGQPSCCQH